MLLASYFDGRGRDKYFSKLKRYAKQKELSVPPDPRGLITPVKAPCH